MLGSVLTGPWVHQLILQPPTPVLQVWLPMFQVCHDTVECNLGSECCEKSCLPKSWEKPAEASPLPLGAMAQSCPCPQSSFGVGCRGVCAWLWTWLWLILMTSRLGLRPGTSLWAHRSPGYMWSLSPDLLCSSCSVTVSLYPFNWDPCCPCCQPCSPLLFRLPKLLCRSCSAQLLGMDHSTSVCLRLLEGMGSDMRDIIAMTMRKTCH